MTHLDSLADIDTPALVVDVEKVQANLRGMADWARACGVALRPHIKTHKVPAIARWQMELGAAGITCAKLGEAEVMAAAGISDILLCYPIVGPLKLERLLALKHTPGLTLRTTVDSVEAAQSLAGAVAAAGQTHEILIEVDAGLGRVGVRTDDDLLRLGAALQAMPGLTVVGVVTHEGHVHKARDADELALMARRAGEHTVRAARLLRDQGHPANIVSVGATPAHRYTPRVPGVTEMRPGTYAFYDRAQVRLGAAQIEQCAATVIATVVSRPEPGMAIIDAGIKAMSSDSVPPDGTLGAIVGHPDWQFAGAYEEHGILRWEPDQSGGPRIGDRVRIIPNHVCGTVNMHDRMYTARGEDLAEVWSIAARGRMQ